ncbi:response regulator transcription factor [Candidatus Gracilibacteria bacterium]|nr:response regulator transcription factor [Candidatus Gracilibacteria bacterium]NUJ99214.1 response regulator transcription factor [Candidatus Gracilibacteria bacterium]
MHKILIIEDDFGISQSLKLYLENSSYEVFLYETGGGAKEFFQKILPDLVILDINLPEKDGIEVCKEIRAEYEIPIIMLTARNSEIDKIKGFETGADDYIGKPFSPRELLVRIQSVLRRSHKEKRENILKFKNIEIDTSRMTVKVNGHEVVMTKNEFDILKKIIEEDGQIVSRQTLMKDIIGYSDYLFDRTIDTHIKNIRRKIEDKDMIVTIRGEGYRLNK